MSIITRKAITRQKISLKASVLDLDPNLGGKFVTAARRLLLRSLGGNIKIRPTTTDYTFLGFSGNICGFFLRHMAQHHLPPDSATRNLSLHKKEKRSSAGEEKAGHGV